METSSEFLRGVITVYLDAYIGRMDDPIFVAERNEPSGSVPRAKSPLFPNGRRAFDGIVERIADGRLKGGATQHIGYVAPATKQQIEAFFADVCLADPSLMPDGSTPHLREQMLSLRQFIAAMDDDGEWALVASEL